MQIQLGFMHPCKDERQQFHFDNAEDAIKKITEGGDLLLESLVVCESYDLKKIVRILRAIDVVYPKKST